MDAPATPQVMPAREERTRGLAVVLAMMVVALAAMLAVRVGAIAVASDRLQQFDMAMNGVDGLRIADALRHGDLLGAARGAWQRDVWPPLGPLLEVPAFLLFGRGYDVAEANEAVLLGLAIVALFLAGAARGGRRGMVAGGVAAALAAASPLVQRLGGLLWLDIQGMLLTALALAAYVRYARFGRHADLVLTCVATVLLFLLKYNYLVLWLLPMALNELGHDLPDARALARRARRALAALRHPVVAALALSALVLVALEARHALRFRFDAGGATHASGLRPWIAAWAVAVILALAARPRVTRDAARRAWRALSPAARTVCMWVLAPVALWLAWPAHLKGMLHVAANRSSELPLLSVANLLFYVRSFVTDEAPAPWLGWIVLALAIVGAIRLARGPRADRIVTLGLVTGFVLCTLHRYKEDRFFLTVAPFAWLACGYALAEGLERAAARASERVRVALAGTVATTALVVSSANGWQPAEARARFDLWTIQTPVRRVLDAIVDLDAGSRGTVVVPMWNRLSPGLIEWHERLRHPDAPEPARPRNALAFGPAAPQAWLDRVAAEGLERVIVLDLAPRPDNWSDAFRDEAPWRAALAAAIARDPRWTLERTGRFEDSGYTLWVYRRR